LFKPLPVIKVTAKKCYESICFKATAVVGSCFYFFFRCQRTGVRTGEAGSACYGATCGTISTACLDRLGLAWQWLPVCKWLLGFGTGPERLGAGPLETKSPGMGLEAWPLEKMVNNL
jgi:hypothetical protein